MTEMLRFDAEAARRTEAAYTTPELVAQRREVLRLLALQPGESVLDIGVRSRASWPRRWPQRSSRAAACSPSTRREHARARPEPRAAALEIRSGSADALLLPDDAVDVAVATQVLEYLPDVHGRAGRVRRVLRPGGRVLVLDTDWDSIVWHSGDPDRMRAVLAAWEEHLADPWLPRTLGPALRDAGFDVGRPPRSRCSYRHGPPHVQRGADPLIADFVVGRRGLDAATVRAWRDDLDGLGEATFFSLNRYLFCARVPT